jgi:hypothetical protein
MSPVGMGGLVSGITNSLFPKTLSPTVWLRSDLGITQSSGLVSAWADQSGNGWNVSQATVGYRPAYISNAVGTIPGIQSSVNQYMTFSPDANTIITTNAAERIVVMYNATDPPVSPSAGVEEYYWGTSGAGTNLPYTDGNIYDGFAASTRPGAPIAHTGINMANVFIYDTAASSGGSWTCWLNGTQLYTTASFTFGIESAASPYILGNTTNCVVLEYLVFNYVLSTSQRTQILNYVSARYGISV